MANLSTQHDHDPAHAGGPERGRTVLAAFAALAVVAGGVVSMVRDTPDDAADVRGRASTFWVSGELRDRVVLATAGAERPSVAVDLDTSGHPIDVVDTGGFVVVADRVSGSIAVFDGRDGSQLVAPFDGPKPVDERPAVVAAGSIAYSVDAAGRTLQRIGADGAELERATIDGEISAWVGTADGVLWLVDRADGRVTSFDGTTVDTQRIAQPGSDLQLSAVGDQPVVLDRTNDRLWWLKSSATADLQHDTNGLIQEPDPGAGGDACVTVLVAKTLRCLTPDGETWSLGFEPDLSGSPQLFATDDTVVVARAGNPLVDAVVVTSTRTTQFQRPAPSSRRLDGFVSGGMVLIDDPGSSHAVTIQRDRLLPLDKFSPQTIVVSPEGDASQGLNVSNQAGDDVEAIVAGDTATKVDGNDDQVNERPVAVGDTATIRVGRTRALRVLGNDYDPDGDLLRITNTTSLSPANLGTILVAQDGETVAFSAGDTVGRAGFGYTVSDPSGLTADADVTVNVIGESTNTAPVLHDDEATTQQGRPIEIPVLLNDEDAEGDVLTITDLSAPALGTVASTEGGTVHYEPNPSSVGVDRFTYTAVDGFGGKATATVIVTIEPTSGENHPPVAVDDRATTAAGVAVRKNVLENDSDPDGDPIRVVFVGEVDHVQATILPDNTISLLPDAGVTGPIEIPYTIADDSDVQASAVIGLQVTGETSNRPPVAVDDAATSAGVPIVINPLENDIDPDGDSLVISGFEQPTSGGTVSRLSPRTLRFVPSSTNVERSVRFAYRAVDPSGQEARAYVTVQVIPPDSTGPIARDDSVTAYKGDPVVINVLGNDTHSGGLPIAVSGQPTVHEGSASVNADGTITYLPPLNQTGTFGFSYTISDQNGRTSTATVQVNVVDRPVVNRPPALSNDSASAIAGAPAITIDVLANDVDPDGDPISLDAVGSVSPQGSASVSGGKVRFSAPSTFTGVATFSYTASDDKGNSATGTVVVLVSEPAKLAPVAEPDLVSVQLPSAVTRDVNPLANDSDPEGGSLTITSVSAPLALPTVIVNNGTWLRITPPDVATQTTYQIQYTIKDNQGLTATSTVTVVISPPLNRPPVAVNDVASVASVATAIDVLSNDSDPDGGSLQLRSVGSVSPTSAGTVARSGNTAVFTPARGFTGPASFSYTIADNAGATATATVSVSVIACVQPAPVLNGDSATAVFGSVQIPVFANDSPHVGTLTISQTPTSGTATITNAAAGIITFEPDTTPFVGTTSFQYRVTNSCDDTAVATVRISGDRPPVAVDDSPAGGNKNQPQTIDVLANDSDPDGLGANADQITITSVTSALHGTVTITNGRVRYSPNNGYLGTDSFDYTISDRGNLTASATVNVVVGNAAPVAVADNSSTTSGVAVTKDVIANDTDADDSNASLAFGSPAPKLVQGTGTLSVGGDGRTLTFTPDAGFDGTAVVSYTVTDGTASSAGTWTIAVTPPNRPPTAIDDQITIPVSGSDSLNPAANDLDPDSDPLSVIGVDDAGLPLTATHTGNTVTITVNAGAASGTYQLPYTISDGNSHTATGTIQVTVPEPNQNPIANPDSTSFTFGSAESKSVAVLGNDSDPEGQSLTVTGVTGSHSGLTAGPSADGKSVVVTYVDAPVGTYDFSYTVSDGNGGTDVATITVTVN